MCAKCRRAALTGSPATDVEETFKNGPLEIRFDPSSMSPEEREGWLRTQEKIARETLPSRTSDATDAEFNKLLGQAQSKKQSSDRERDDLHNQLRDLNQQMTNLDAESTKAQANASEPPATSSPPIPPGWVPCTCPADHPNAGILVGGTRYHTPLLKCPQ